MGWTQDPGQRTGFWEKTDTPFTATGPRQTAGLDTHKSVCAEVGSHLGCFSSFFFFKSPAPSDKHKALRHVSFLLPEILLWLELIGSSSPLLPRKSPPCRIQSIPRAQPQPRPWGLNLILYYKNLWASTVDWFKHTLWKIAFVLCGWSLFRK